MNRTTQKQIKKSQRGVAKGALFFSIARQLCRSIQTLTATAGQDFTDISDTDKGGDTV